MDARLMGEGVRADDGLIWLHDHAGIGADHAARAGDLSRVHALVQAEDLRARVYRHHDFFQQRVAGPFADAVDRHLYLTGAVADAGQGVRRGQAEVVVAVHRPDDPFGAGRILDQVVDQP